MPVGLVGLLITGIFSSTVSSMDSGLNRNSGIFIKNVYQPLMRPHASEKELVTVGKIATVFMGVIVILLALMYSSWKNIGLFKLMINFSALVGVPYAIPLFWGLLVKRTPAWSCWSTVLICLALSAFVSHGLHATSMQPLVQALGLEGFAAWAKVNDFVAMIGVNIILGSAWFLGSQYFYPRACEDYRKRAEAFFDQMHQPIDFKKEIGEESDGKQAKTLGVMCLIYATFIALLVLIPNSILNRGCIFFCALFMGGIGALLYRQGSRKNS